MYRHQAHALDLALTSYSGDIEGLVILFLHFHCLDSRVKAFDDGMSTVAKWICKMMHVCLITRRIGTDRT